MPPLQFNNIAIPVLPSFEHVKIFHPGYEDEKAPLITFIGVDTGGLAREVAFTACAIISNNFSGWLENKDGRVDDPVLAAGDYWWHLQGT